MRNMLFYIMLAFLLTHLCILQAQPRIYIYLNSHNEDQANYFNDSVGYNNYIIIRNNMKKLAEMVQDKDLAYNYGADYVELLAIAQFDTGVTLANTNNKNLVKWMQEDKGIECSPHSHENAYNYADVAYLMMQLGITPTNIINGFLYDSLQNGNSWNDYQNGITGDSFPSFTWYPEIMWGPATQYHVNDPHYLGIWKPKSLSAFTIHEPSNHLIICGTGCSISLNENSTVEFALSKLKATINAIENGLLPSNIIYPQIITFAEGDMNSPWLLPLIDSLTDSISKLVLEQEVEWKTMSAIIDYWKTDLSQQAFAYDCEKDYATLIEPSNGIIENTNKESTSLFPNPGNGLIYFDNTDLKNKEISIYDQTGYLLMHKNRQASDEYIDCSTLASGLYYIKHNQSFQKYILIR